jgi:DNA-binding NarL/FixJ family response regulator
MEEDGGRMTTRVLLADDHALFVHALAQLLPSRFEVVDIVGDGRALQAAARKHKPDVIVTDITMPVMSGLESIRSLRNDPYVPKAVFLTMHADAELARECFTCGGAFLTKVCSSDELIQAIDSVMANQFYLSSDIAAGLMDVLKEPTASGPEFEQLTARQREILQLVGEGKTMKEIASLTNLSTRTVEWHKYRMMRILGLRRNAELVQHAVRMKLVV